MQSKSTRPTPQVLRQLKPVSYPNPATPNGYMVSAPWRSSGKTLISIGLAREAYRRQKSVQTFKKGPDYIDPRWLACASGRGCYNLDLWFQQPEELTHTYTSNITSDAFALVEGTMGLHDGLLADGSDSNAAVARQLGLKVILVVDCRGMHRTIAALVNGLQQFDRKVEFAGVVLNRVRSARHADKICRAINQHCDLAVLGVIPESAEVKIAEKQLGLTPAPEFEQTNKCVDAIADLVSAHCDLNPLLDAVPEQTCVTDKAPGHGSYSGFKVGIAKDEAFHFYYQDDLDYLKQSGIELIELSPLHDAFPDQLDGLIIGGGFPERHAHQLMQNAGFRDCLRKAIDNGLVVHAECAGLMYLCSHLQVERDCFDMVGCLNARVSMHEKPVGRGYATLRRLDDDKVRPAHEFHHSSIEFNDPVEFAFAVERGYGVDGEHDGVVYRNVSAGYSHFRHTSASPWIDEFLGKVAANRLTTGVSTP